MSRELQPGSGAMCLDRCSTSSWARLARARRGEDRQAIAATATILLAVVMAAACAGRQHGPPAPREALAPFGPRFVDMHHECMGGEPKACSSLAYFIASPGAYNATFKKGWSYETMASLKDCSLAETYGTKNCELDSSSKYCQQTPCEYWEEVGRRIDSTMPEAGIEDAEAVLASLAGTPAEELALRCRGGGAADCRRLGHAFRKGDSALGVQADARSSATLSLRGCRSGDSESCGDVGVAFEKGRGVAQNAQAAERYFRDSHRIAKKRCDEGIKAECVHVAYAYVWGSQVSRDVPEAARRFEALCDAGEGPACTGLGFLYAYSDQFKFDFETDFARAAEYYLRACEANDPAGCASLGDLYRDGVVARSDGREGYELELYRRSCELGRKSGYDHGCKAVEELGR